MAENIFTDARVYVGHTSLAWGDHYDRSGLVVEQDGEVIHFFVEDGDNGGRGADRRRTHHEISFEKARELMEALFPVLYGER